MSPMRRRLTLAGMYAATPFVVAVLLVYGWVKTVLIWAVVVGRSMGTEERRRE